MLHNPAEIPHLPFWMIFVWIIFAFHSLGSWSTTKQKPAAEQADLGLV